MKSLIIGGSGFVGAYLLQHLKELGHETAVTKMPQEQFAAGADDVFDLDILRIDMVEEILGLIKPDYIFHLAAQSSVAVSWEKPGMTADVNIRGCMNVLEAVRRQKKKMRVLLIGSGEEYGKIRPDELPVREDHALRPDSIYAVTKACQNMAGAVYARAYGMEVVMVRAFNHIGPHQSPRFVVPDFCRQAAEIEAGIRGAVIKTGNLDAKRDFTDVRDVVRAYALLAEKGKAGETYNVGSGCAVRIRDILQIILELSKVRICVETDPERFRPLDTAAVAADISKMQKITGWKPQIGLRRTIQETLDACREEVIALR